MEALAEMLHGDGFSATFEAVDLANGSTVLEWFIHDLIPFSATTLWVMAAVTNVLGRGRCSGATSFRTPKFICRAC